MFNVTDKETGKQTNMSISQYFMKKYKVYLENPKLPLLETTKLGEVYPMELAVMSNGQRYPFKLTEDQVSVLQKALSMPLSLLTSYRQLK